MAVNHGEATYPVCYERFKDVLKTSLKSLDTEITSCKILACDCPSWRNEISAQSPCSREAKICLGAEKHVTR